MRSASQRAEEHLLAQRLWMHEHGGTELAYIVRYGSKNAPGHYGDGGEAIYRADLNELRKREREFLAALQEDMAWPE